MSKYGIDEFVEDLLDTDEVVDILNDCDKSWDSIVRGFISRNKGTLIEESNYQQEILLPYLIGMSELLEEYETGIFKVTFVEAINQGGVNYLLWQFTDTTLNESLYVYKSSTSDERVSSAVHPILAGDVNPCELSPSLNFRAVC